MDLPSTQSFINKVPQNTDSGHNFILKTDWLPDEINIQIFDCNNAKEWQGKVSFNELKQSARELEIPYEKYLEECKLALTTNGGAEYFEYFIEARNFKVIKRKIYYIRYLEIDLKANSKKNSNFTLAAVDMIASLKAELIECKKTNEDLNEKYQNMVETADRCLEEKNDLEKSLLKKFAVLLNSKKDKIAELQNLLVEKDKILEDAGVSSEGSAQNQSKRKSTDGIGDDEDFLLPTQVMSQTVARTLPKRVKLAS